MKKSLNSDGKQFSQWKVSLKSDGQQFSQWKASLNSDGQQFFVFIVLNGLRWMFILLILAELLTITV
jgi:hypothetical protein